MTSGRETAETMPNAAMIERRRDELIARYGPWIENIYIADGVYTRDTEIDYDQAVTRRLVQTVSDLCCKPINELRVLDLACSEGIHALEFARHGAQVLGVEIREEGLEKSRFVQWALGLENVEFVQDDVRAVTRERYGSFDVVLCLGILYHLDAPDVFQFIENVTAMCDGLLILDTHISLENVEQRLHGGNSYWGWSYLEHAPEATPEQRRDSLYSSIDNTRSFWLTRLSLYNLLIDSGYTSVLESHVPVHLKHLADRVTLVARKGTPVTTYAAPVLGSGDRYPDPWHRTFLTDQPAPIRTPFAGYEIARRRRMAKSRLRPAKGYLVQFVFRAGKVLPQPYRRRVRSLLARYVPAFR